MLSVCLFYVFMFMFLALVSKLSILSCSCCILYCVLHYDNGVLLHLIWLLLLLMCHLTVCIIVYPGRFCFHGSWRVRVFYASVVLMTWYVHVWWRMIHRVLCIIAQYDICCVLDQCGRCRCAGCCDSCVRYVLLVTRHRPSVPTLEARRIEMTDVSTSIACGCLSFI